MPEKYITGIRVLDEVILNGGFDSGSLVAVAGHPGSGKTSFASMVAYYNGIRDRKILYLTFQESKKKLFSHMKKLGLDLEGLEREGLLTFIRLPVISSPEAAEDVINKISGLIYESKADVLIVDSVNPLLEALDSSVDRRGVLQNFFYSVPELIGGLAVIIVEIPYGESNPRLIGGVDFVADAVIVLHHRLEGDYISRFLEIRKLRGHEIPVAKFPFTIKTGTGIRLWAPLRLEEIPSPSEGKRYRPPCSTVGRYLGDMLPGMITYTSYPADARVITPIIFMGVAALYNRAKTMFISFTYSPGEIWELMGEVFKGYMGFGDKSGMLVNMIKKYVKIYSINVNSYSSSELYSRILDVLNEEKPEIVVFVGFHSLYNKMVKDMKDNLLNNILLYLKYNKIYSVILSSYTGEKQYWWTADTADSVIRYSFIVSNGSNSTRLVKYIYAWRKGREPVLLDVEAGNTCCDEIKELLEKMLRESG